MKYISVFMDVEDPINSLADDAALDFARLFTEAGVRGSFCLTGEKCRTLLARGRRDVLDAYASHCLGLHTDTHSFHPSTMEMLAEPDFESGCQAALDTEGRGYHAFETAFDRPPSFWGGGGNTWSPEISHALKAYRIPAYVYALTALPDEAVHLFNGVLALPQAMSISETDWADDERASIRSERVLAQIFEIDQPWLGLFVGHPTKFRYSDFWDVPYFGGRTPPEPEYTAPLPDETYERGKANLRVFLKRLRETVKIVGVDEAIAFPWSFYPPTNTEAAFFRAQTAKNLRSAIGWPIHRPGLSAANIVAKTLALADTVQVAKL